ncbi:hypothetical protein RBSWK_01928 [Rhodopirellula baltica SWK14]|uniref:Uncharacterized protein n=1 Tax=Rhodopirellula baltica SWK14 TaxID=993516 RepID=L7CJW5_RHOBT|nr:hypothetical protein RBSWK_01928 [Rhodopirellula baltica SWK14]
MYCRSDGTPFVDRSCWIKDNANFVLNRLGGNHRQRPGIPLFEWVSNVLVFRRFPEVFVI